MTPTAPRARHLGRHGVAVVLALAALGVGGGQAIVGHAAGLSVGTGRVTVLRPPQLPPKCATDTLAAAADTWVNQQAATTNYGTATSMSVTARAGRSARSLLRFTLPTAPAGCSLSSAKLRVFNTAPTAGRTIQVFAAAAAWSETSVTYDTMPATAGTGVGVAASAGFMEWTVTAHVQTMYTGTNNGFVVRDSVEGGSTTFTQQFASRESATSTSRPELILTWQQI